MPEPLPAPLARAVGWPEAISLAQLQAQAELTTRTDRKYIVTEAVAGALVEELAAEHRILEIDGRRSFTYRSNYFDSPSLGAFRAHVQGRRRRYKCRTRHYVDSNLYTFEVKLKGRRGETVKHQLACSAEEYQQMGDAARTFAERVVAEAYGVEPGDLVPTLETEYRRVTLAAADGSSRVTCDVGVAFASGGASGPRLRDGYAIVETKSSGPASHADRALAAMGVRPVACSKYCAGIALLRDDVKDNMFRAVLRRYFEAGSVPALGTAVGG